MFLSQMSRTLDVKNSIPRQLCSIRLRLIKLKKINFHSYFRLNLIEVFCTRVITQSNLPSKYIMQNDVASLVSFLGNQFNYHI